MVKKSVLLLLSLLLLVLSGCSGLFGTAGTSAGKIIPPSNPAGPFEGKWTVLEELNPKEDAEDASRKWTGSSIQFVEGVVAFDNILWDKISYKIKKVQAVDYLMTKYVSHSDFFEGESQEVDVVTVYASDNYLGEFMKIDDSNMVFFVQDAELLLQKVSDQADNMLEASMASVQSMNQVRNEKSSGVLMGLRIPGEAGYTYRTLWIAADRDRERPVLMWDGLFFPRTSGFWELEVRNISFKDRKGNLLTARSAAAKAADNAVPETVEEDGSKDGDEAEAKIVQLKAADFSEKTINYIGNDYIAIERNIAGAARLRVWPVDNLSSQAEVNLSDLMGEKGTDPFPSAREQAVEALKSAGARFIETDDLGGNFGLSRKNGHWLLAGRINYQEDGSPAYRDFDVNIVPPVNLVSYDTLVLSWYKIKDRVPDALDAFTSPNKDIALVKTKNKLSIYKITGEQLAKNPMKEIELSEGTAIIMAEWAVGSYVESWENSFLSYGAQPLSDN